MPLPVILATIAVAVALPLLGWSVLYSRLHRDRTVQSNLARGLLPAAVLGPERGQRLTALAKRYTPARIVARLDRLLAAKFLLTILAAALGMLFVAGGPTALRTFLALFVAVLSYFVPDLLLYSRGTERQNAIAMELPDTLDQMTIAVEAGLGFEAAMARAAHNGKGALAQELVRTLQDMQVGRSRREAYLDLAERTTVTDLRRFVRSIIQADLYGISISGVLRTQAAEMRLKRRQKAEEKAMEIPVKVLFPLMFCILPVLFIVLLGPAAIGIVNTLNK